MNVRRYMAPLSSREKLPPYLWLLAPIMLPVALLVMIPLGILALIAAPYYFVYPEHHIHQWDFEGTERQKALLVKWRTGHKRLGLFGRIRRGFLVLGRRTRTRRAKKNLSVS